MERSSSFSRSRLVLLSLGCLVALMICAAFTPVIDPPPSSSSSGKLPAAGAVLIATPQPELASIGLAIQATRTPRPTSTPVPIPPPADPTTANLMILFAALAVAIIIIGIWINRRAFTSGKDPYSDG